MMFLILASTSLRGEEAADSLPSLNGNWFQQLKAADYKINDPSINYPRFLNFVRKVYNWTDSTFNSYNPAYVVSTGKNWKASIKNQNTMQSYVYDFSLKGDNRVLLRSNISSELGFSVNFMGVSVGYTWDVATWPYGENDNRRTFNFSFTTALFSAELTSINTDGLGRVSQLGSNPDLLKGKRYMVPVDQTLLNFNAYYFFNNRNYSQAAAYSFSKYQKQSAGSWLLGFDYNRQRINIDFSDLPRDLLAQVADLPLNAYYRYTDYNLMAGYAHNFVMPHGWLVNMTVLPSIGYRRMRHRAQLKSELVSLASIVKCSVTYNHRALFTSILLNFDGNMLFASKYLFFNSTESLSAVVGVRF